MKKYLELTETVVFPNIPDFIRAEITDKTEAEITDIQKAMIDVMSGKDYRLVEHTCGHDERGACIMRRLV